MSEIWVCSSQNHQPTTPVINSPFVLYGAKLVTESMTECVFLGEPFL